MSAKFYFNQLESSKIRKDGVAVQLHKPASSEMGLE